jgi:hypothetical protein
MAGLMFIFRPPDKPTEPPAIQCRIVDTEHGFHALMIDAGGKGVDIRLPVSPGTVDVACFVLAEATGMDKAALVAAADEALSGR